VIKFVGQLRVRNGDNAALSPTLAEQLILSALRDTPLQGEFSETATAYTQFLLLRELVSDLDGERLDVLLTRAQDDADRWITTGRAGQ
jgi:hypothetical protein